MENIPIKYSEVLTTPQNTNRKLPNNLLGTETKKTQKFQSPHLQNQPRKDYRVLIPQSNDKLIQNGDQRYNPIPHCMPNMQLQHFMSN